MGAGIDVKMNYDQMEDMAKAFDYASRQLGDTISKMDKVAKMLEEGALLGAAGEEFVRAIRGPLTKRLTTLRSKMDEMAKDIRHSVSDTRQGVADSKAKYG